MKLLPVFFPGFHRSGLGRKPVAAYLKTAQQVRALDAHCLAHLEVLFGHGLPSWLRLFKADKGTNSRQRTFTPVLTFWAFFAQVLDVNGSCRRALQRVQALCAAKGLASISQSTAAYCRARARLSARLLMRILRHVSEAVVCASGGSGFQGRLLVMDGTAITLQDTAENRAQYEYASGQKPGCGFPLMHLLGLFDLRSGAWLEVVKSNELRHDSHLAWKLIGKLRAGDTLIADRAFCSYAFIAQLRAIGVHVVMRLHQARAKTMHKQKGCKLGCGDHLHRWKKPPVSALKALHPSRIASLPEHLDIRIVIINLASRGHRPAPMYFATTLLEPKAHSAPDIAALYLRRWDVELFFDDIKTSQGMDMLRCQSPHMVARELLMHMITYNLVRLLINQADTLRPPAEVGRISFKGTLDAINQWHPALWACRSAKQAKERYVELLQQISEDIVIPRPGRREPRVIKRRNDSYKLMTQPRCIMRTLPEPPKHPTRKHRRCLS